MGTYFIVREIQKDQETGEVRDGEIHFTDSNPYAIAYAEESIANRVIDLLREGTSLNNIREMLQNRHIR
ncbi:hypothetical protein A2872_02950 [Candidatus Gottesmanbacteria bacterium RIFCSPHIGHO2_01_FULL_42_12]|uniref:Uncharacterized protein n=1 Tax=Candidatus Gottesmanbacteria bacterium RIFCSPHIGHO2_01_FULL_42_12 TaxID=1798377 RepID=A0A1F5Z4N3_9BACT|nr:MAG: hypothetical protein A2872_02950 [Candidatus Gottesmanbacteria bacterium RIFCSPHIGHO2_01_FULL_42_12]